MSGVTINWFEIPVEDLARASTFYGAILAVDLGEMEGPAGVMKTFQNGDAPVGALVAGEHNSPSMCGPLVYFGVPDIEAVLGRVDGAGGEVVLPKTSIGAYGSIAQFIDPEGNRIALHSN